MRRYLQLTITEPLEPVSTSDDRAQIGLVVIGIDLATGKVTLPSGFVCSLKSLEHAVDTMITAQGQWIHQAWSLGGW